MNWEELAYKLSYLKIERDKDIDSQLSQKSQAQRIYEKQGSNKLDQFQDKQNPYNYIVPFEGETEYSDNIEYLDTQYDEDEDNDNQNQEGDNENYDDYDHRNNFDEKDYKETQDYLLNEQEQRQFTQAQKINMQQCQFFEEFDDKENEYYADLNKNDMVAMNIKNSDYFPPLKRPLEQSVLQNQQNINNVTQLRKANENQLEQFKKQGTSDQLSIAMLNTFTTLGTGSFGRVKLAKIKGNDRDVYALKMMKKIEIVKLKQVDHIKSEKKILSQIKHPFLVELKGTFQDECYIYMLFEFLSGGEIFSRLRKEGRFSNDISLFYVTEIYLALQYLHSQNIVYRDLKPENLLIDRDGHVKIADFGFAKIMDSTRTYTLCGTPEYLAPEIIQGAKTGYGKSVDWWALGVLIFEMLSGHPPFYDSDPMGIYQKIVQSVINFPSFFSLRAKDLIRKLLNPNIAKRLGCYDDGISIKSHKWFKGINWEKIYHKQIPSPWIPVLKSKDDVSCFEKYPESAENLENPSKEIQKLFLDF